SRYFLQAEEQLKGTEIKMQKLRVPNAVPPEVWLAEKLESGSRVGVDAQTISVAGFRSLTNTLSKKNIELVETPDLLENTWDDRPLNSTDKVFELETEYAGASRKQKQAKVAEQLRKAGAGFQVVSMLDELAWLYNLRGSDINYNPVFTGFGFIGENKSYLFVDDIKISSKVKEALKKDGVELKKYTEFYSFLSEIKGERIFLDASTANYSVYSSLKEKNEIVEGTSVISFLKAQKNKTELNGFKKAMEKDGVALVEFLFWLKNTLGTKEISEYDVGCKLREFRAKQTGFQGESFPPIVGYKSHGAIVHLSVSRENALPVKPEGILLFDSGGQYLDGTTDVTRTVALGPVSEKQKRDYTLVLKGMIGLTEAKFPFGTKGCHIDILARQSLWENGMNYGHGTGHGVGHFLNVHEGPMAIRQELNENLIEPGMVMSNEPGMYREGEYGIRTENMIVCVEKEETEFGRFLGFETLTLCPIDTTLIDRKLITLKETEWLNNYHAEINERLKPLLKEELHTFLDELTRRI
ncbi:MAG: aminopeptidase P family protein, partial [Bacteroidota bacterium]